MESALNISELWYYIAEMSAISSINTTDGERFCFFNVFKVN
jgi:hypothetical protein